MHIYLVCYHNDEAVINESRGSVTILLFCVIVFYHGFFLSLILMFFTIAFADI